MDSKERWNMIAYHVKRYNGDCDVLLLPHKDGTGFSYVNLTSGHICPCKFDTVEEAERDMFLKSNVIDFERIGDIDNKITNLFSSNGGES